LPQSEDKIAMVYIGRAPTFSLPQRMFEVHIFDHDGSPLYGKNIVVKLHKFIREDRSFKSVDELKRQIDDDAMRTKQIFKFQH
ncbi:riboflavin biosynthesis protein RibF, partial [bacterium]